MTTFINVYKFYNDFDAEFKTDDEAIDFANNHDWTVEKLHERDYYVQHCEYIGTTNDDKINVYFDFDMNSYFFVYTGFITDKNLFNSFLTWIIMGFWKWFKNPKKWTKK